MANIKELPLSSKQVQIFPSEICNLACNGCPYPDYTPDKRRTLKSKEMTPEQWTDVNNFLYEEGNRLFCIMGGEPCSYRDIDKVIKGITSHPDAFVLLSTSGIHMLNKPLLRKKIGDALAQPANRAFKNGIAISFDTIPSDGNPKDSREFKAGQGLKLVRKMRQEYGDEITYVANVMVTPESLPKIPEIQEFLEKEDIYTNLCTQQMKCFGHKQAIFNDNHITIAMLKTVGAEMIKRKTEGKKLANSTAYLSQLPGVVGMEDYQCWTEHQGNPVIDVGPDGKLRYCNWIGQNLHEGPPGIHVDQVKNNGTTWDEFWTKSQDSTRMLCGGCSWSRRDRNIEPMVGFNTDIFDGEEIPVFDPNALKNQNVWVQAQLSVVS